MMIFKKAIPRRTFLKGVGATLALPLLDGMVPAMAAVGDKRATRLSFVYIPNGIIMDQWTPAAEGAGFEMTPILEPLAPYRDQMLVLSGLDCKNANPQPGEGGGDHERGSGAFLTGVHPKKTGGTDIEAGTSIDQVAAKELGNQTELASLELTLDFAEFVGGCDPGYSCAYTNTLCWRSPNTPIPMENNPRAVFERLFGSSDTTDPAERLARIKKDRSILDAVRQDVARLVPGLGPTDRRKLTEYLDAVRDVERRIQKAEEQSSQELPSLVRPVGIPATFEDHIKLMFDLQVLAYQTDKTRVITFLLAHEQSTRAYPEIGIHDPHHPLTHHSGDQEKISKVIEIQKYHARMFSYFLEKMQATPDGDGNLLDHTMIVYGGSISDANVHKHEDLPILLIGGGDGKIKGGRHVRYPKDTPVANLFVTVLDKMGTPAESFGDSTGELDLSLGV
jgi:hypothetical protein